MSILLMWTMPNRAEWSWTRGQIKTLSVSVDSCPDSLWTHVQIKTLSISFRRALHKRYRKCSNFKSKFSSTKELFMALEITSKIIDGPDGEFVDHSASLIEHNV